MLELLGKHFKKIILIFIILECIFFFSLIVPKVNFFSQSDSIKNRTIKIDKVPQVPSPYKLIWWEVKDNTLNLKINSLNDSNNLSLHGALNNKATYTIPIENQNNIIPLQKDYSGSFMAILNPFNADINNDGAIENIKVYAKLDTLFTQGFEPKWTLFNKDVAAMDIYHVDEHSLKVLYNGKPLNNKEIQVISSRGLNQQFMLDNDGIVKINDVRDVRSGITIVYTDGNNVNIVNYLIESRQLFTKQHLRALYPVATVFSVSINIVVIILLIRNSPFRKKSVLTELRKT
jgi:hypothetical protein